MKDLSQQHSLQAFPIKKSHVVLDMQSLGELSSSKSPVKEAYKCNISVHVTANCESLTESQFVRTVMQRNLAKLVTKKLPITTEKLSAIMDDA